MGRARRLRGAEGERMSSNEDKFWIDEYCRNHVPVPIDATQADLIEIARLRQVLMMAMTTAIERGRAAGLEEAAKIADGHYLAEIAVEAIQDRIAEGPIRAGQAATTGRDEGEGQ
jgi:hypothetical protein